EAGWEGRQCLSRRSHLHSACYAAQFARLNLRGSIAATAPEDAQDEEEQVDKIQEELESAYQGKPSGLVRRTGEGGPVTLEPLRVVGNQAGEDQHACIGDNPVDGGIAQEDVDDARYDQPDQRHDQDGAEAREIYPGCVADKTKQNKHARSHSESGSNG